MNWTPKKKKPLAPWTRTKGTTYRVPDKKTRRIKPRTSQRASEARRYNARVKVWLVGRLCEANLCWNPATNPATQVHHKRGRIGALLNDERHWMGVCDDCHKWMHTFPAKAKEWGWLAGAGQWNSVPK